MLTYNTQLKPLRLPEYGRNIHQMVEYCVSILDREERNVCAHAIIRAMGNLFPALRDDPEAAPKLWDHLAIMSEFQLDIDYPYEVVTPDSLHTLPQPVRYPGSFIPMRHYGKMIFDMVDKATSLPEGEERDELVVLIANHMKKLQMAVNKDGVDDAKIFKDLAEISHGAIWLSTETHSLNDYKIAPAPATVKKKKKK